MLVAGRGDLVAVDQLILDRIGAGGGRGFQETHGQIRLAFITLGDFSDDLKRFHTGPLAETFQREGFTMFSSAQANGAKSAISGGNCLNAVKICRSSAAEQTPKSATSTRSPSERINAR